MQVVKIQQQNQLLAGSVPGWNGEIHAPTWGDKALEFGGWDVEWEEEEL
jgi:hypothetical protein